MKNNFKYEDLGNMAFRNMSWSTKMDAIVGKFDLEIFITCCDTISDSRWARPSN